MRSQVSGPLLLALAFACLSVSPILALPPQDHEQIATTKSFDYGTYSDTNDVLMFVTNRGWLAHDPTALLGRPSGLYFPRGGNKTMVYSAGLWMAAKLGKGYRASVAEYEADFSPGPIVNGSYLPDNEKFRVYKIARGDSYDSNIDYDEWPYDQGAPALKDHAGGDSLGWSGRRIPRVMGDQTFWCVFNDANLANHTSDPGSVQPLKIEVQFLAWSDEWPGSLGRTVFMHYTIINKSDSTLREARIGLWADPDIGRSGDDLAGCDTALSLGYCYNNGPDLLYGDAPPAVGLVLLSGPSVDSPNDSVWSLRDQRRLHNRRALPMTGFAAWKNGEDPSGESNAYYVLSGRDPTGFPQVDPTNNLPTTFFYSGDPVAQTGWVDPIPSDRRIVIGSGPVTIAPGDTHEIVVAMVVGHGDDALASIVSLKQAAQTTQTLWRGHFAETLPATVDILPGSCPNVVSFAEPIELDFDFIRPAAAIPTTNITVALYGTPDFDAAMADPREVFLAGVAPSGWTIEDVGRPDVRETPCGCAHSSRDGLVDLVLSFERDEIAHAIQPVVEGAIRTLAFHAVTRDGARGLGRDCLTFVDVVVDSGPINPPFMPGEDEKQSRFSVSNQPNPFNAATTISYRIATDGPVRVEVYDILGRRMTTLVDAWQRAGEYQIMWNGVDLHGDPAGSGMYFYRLQSDDGVMTRKMILLK